MSTLCPYRIIKGDDGLSVKVEWDAHYLTDEQIGIVRKYIAEVEAENEKLRELCVELYHELYAAIDEYWPASYLGDLEPRDVFPRYDELIELGVEV